MGFEYEAIPNDPDDYRRRRDALARQARTLPSFIREYGSFSIGLSDGANHDERWGDPVRVEFGEDRLRMLCTMPLRGALLADVRELMRMAGATELNEL